MAKLIDSYYEASVVRPTLSPPLQGDTQVDVCVIGGGYTGLSCALELAQAGRSVLVLEAVRVGWGASGRNGGQALCGYSTEALAAPAKQAGVEEKYLFDLSVNAVALVRDRIRRFNIQCDWQDGAVTAALHARHCRELEQYANALSRYAYPVQLLDMVETRENIASRRYCGAMVDDKSGHLHPLKYLLGLARAATDAGVKICEMTAATKVEEIKGGVKIHTAQGVVHCQQAVSAGNAYLDIDVPWCARIMPVSTYIGATEPLDADMVDNLIAERRAVCDMNFALDYFRCSGDNRLLFGGRASYANLQPHDLTSVIRQRIKKVFPQLAAMPLEYVWGGSVAITVNRFPDIGRQGAMYYAHGYSGHGVALSGFAGKMIAEAILGDSEQLDVFGRVKHTNFIGGKFLRMPLLALAMLYYQLRDLIG
ncbi:MAG: NAD(P)/FAD-dependent oxidoreductase [Gammaproteobacteria bacterium WSBS_2016_MAG_OTU1]